MEERQMLWIAHDTCQMQSSSMLNGGLACVERVATWIHAARSCRSQHMDDFLENGVPYLLASWTKLAHCMRWIPLAHRNGCCKTLRSSIATVRKPTEKKLSQA